MKTHGTLKQRLIWLTLLCALAATLLAPVVAQRAMASANEPAKVAVNWNGRAPAPTPRP